MSIAPCLSTGKDDWATPDDLYTTYNALFGFVLDAAADRSNHKCARWFGPGGESEDALSVVWPTAEGNIWLNPPYSKGLQSRFVRKAFEESLRHARNPHWLRPNQRPPGRIVCLLPARTDTKLFHEVIQPFAEVTFLKGRVKFKGAKHGAPFPSMIVVF